MIGPGAVAWSMLPPFDYLEYPAPLVSVILTTRDRPRFIQIALRCYSHQTYPLKELIVVDDSSTWPVDANDVATLGGQLIRVEAGTPLGTKLNRGIEASRGFLCSKMDDDDWYGPGFLEHVVSAWRRSQRYQSLPVVQGCTPHQVFNLNRWEVRSTWRGGIAGGTLLFSRQVWEQRPFRPLVKAEDGWFIMDQVRLGARLLRVDGKDTFLQVRHGDAGIDRGHTWRYWWDSTVEEVFAQFQIYKRPEDLLPDWANDAYVEIRDGRPERPLSLARQTSRRSSLDAPS